MTTPSTAAIVTGCSSGIGRAVALRLADAGYPVYATARRVEALAELAEAGLVTQQLDVDDEQSRGAAVERVIADHGAVGILVTNAGFGLRGTVEETPLDDVRNQFETSVFGLVRLTQLVLPGMREQGYGRVVTIGSTGGRSTFPGGGFHQASEHALESVSDALRLEVAPFGVRVSLVQPGPLRRSGAADEPRRGTPAPAPEDVARVVVDAVRSSRPRARYAVGWVARSLITTRRLAPDAVWDRFVRT